MSSHSRNCPTAARIVGSHGRISRDAHHASFSFGAKCIPTGTSNAGAGT